MYNKHLEAFMAVADYGTLSHAAEILFLTPPALMRQINQLEEHLGVKLFVRNNKGLVLSEAGKALYDDSKYMIQYSKQAVARAQKSARNGEYVISIGTSPMAPAEKIAPLLQTIAQENPRFQFYIVPYQDYREEYTQVVSRLGEREIGIDIIAGIYGFSDWTTKFHRTLYLSGEPVCVAVSKRHRLAAYDEIEVEELNGETLLLTEHGDSPILDKIRRDLEKRCPDAQFISRKAFDLMIYNHAATTEDVLITTPMWAKLHPLLKSVRVNWKYEMPYGILYAMQPSEGVEAFITAAAGVKERGEKLIAW